MTITEQLELLISEELQDKHRSTFEKQARYVGSNTYAICQLYSNDTRELFLMYIAQQEQIEYEKD